jgi:PTH1 family peptidyl-tRNA hydrolase
LSRIFVVGLGNPGDLYAKTRHNVGSMFVDYFASKLGIKFKPGKGEFIFALYEEDIYLVKPLTFVNFSGRAIIDLIKVYSIEDKRELIVVVDDVNLTFGRLRLRMKGGAGGHRGLSSIIHLIGSEFPRLRIGVGPSPFISLKEFVLSPFEEDEFEALPYLFEHAIEGIKIYKKRGPEQAMQFINTWFYNRENQDQRR